MELAEQQRKLSGLLRSGYHASSDDDPYIQKVARSRDLQEAQRNVLLWRVYVLERTAALTFTLLKRRNLLEQTLSAFIIDHNISPFRETQAPAFLKALSSHPDSLVAAVAQFELALLKVRQGDSRSYVVSWDVEPHSILNSLARNIAFQDEIPAGSYQILISRDLPGQFQIVALNAEEAVHGTLALQA